MNINNHAVGRRFLWLCLGVLLLVVGCQENTAPEATRGLPKKASEPLPASARVFPTRGVIRSIPAGGKTVVVRHEEIPGYMQAMTMELTLGDPSELGGFAEGDALEFELVALEDRHWIQGLKRIQGTQVGAHRGPVPLATPKLLPLVESGQAFPDVQFRSEDGEAFGFSNLRGKAVAFTFFFTRCPLPEFCPRMLKNFSRTRNELIQRSEAGTNWIFLSISFDHESDTPEVLKRHARAYRGQESENWKFCSADTNAMSVLIPSVQLMVAKDGESFSHNLRTVVVDTRGRVHRRFDGNEWTPAELATAVLEASKVGL